MHYVSRTYIQASELGLALMLMYLLIIPTLSMPRTLPKFVQAIKPTCNLNFVIPYIGHSTQ